MVKIKPPSMAVFYCFYSTKIKVLKIVPKVLTYSLYIIILKVPNITKVNFDTFGKGSK